MSLLMLLADGFPKLSDQQKRVKYLWQCHILYIHKRGYLPNNKFEHRKDKTSYVEVFRITNQILLDVAQITSISMAV
jgi:hypothetical protein